MRRVPHLLADVPDRTGQVDALLGERGHVIVLDHHRVGKPVTVVVPAAADDRVFFECTQSGSGFARIDDTGTCVGVRSTVAGQLFRLRHGAHKRRGHGGDAAHALGEVQGDAFRGKQVTYRPAHGGKRLARLETFPVRDMRRDFDGWILRGECRGEHVDAAHHALFTGGEPSLALRLRGNRGFAGDVAVGRILGERGFHGVADDLTGQHGVPFIR